MSDKAIRMVAAYSILWIGSGPTQGQNSNSLPPNVKGTNAAWHALQSKRPRDAADKADQVIEKFTTQAEKIEADLKSKNMPAPIIGKPSTDKERAEILDRGPLNDVATCYFIKGQALELLGDKPGAKQAYQAACHLTYARTWDTHGWFWDPADKSCKLARRIK